jgi:TatD DNase family protein
VRIFDTHAHLDAPQFEGDLAGVIERAKAAGVERILCVGTDLRSSRRCLELARRFPGRLRVAVGIHPNHWAEAREGDFEAVERLAAEREVVAVGETGLDFHHAFTPPDAQVEAFRRHLGLAASAELPVVIHARKADEETLRVLAEQDGPVRGVRHCFDGSVSVAGRYVALGLHVSVGAIVTREGHKRLKAAVAALPAERVLVETDCPYQAPACRAGERNEPAFIVETVRAVARLRGDTPDELAALTTANAEALFAPRSTAL